MAIGDVAVPTATPAPTKVKAEFAPEKREVEKPEAFKRGSVDAMRAAAEPVKKPNDDQGSEWENFSVEKWRDAVYTSRSFFSELFIDTTNFVGKLCDDLGGNSESGPLLVEVGCGTGEALVPLFQHADGATPRARYTCGMDFNPHFIKYCRDQVAEEDQADVRHLVGDAQELIALINDELPKEWDVQSREKVVICVGNTVGIMPPDIRKNVYQQMKDLAGVDGYVVVVYWNGNRFGDAVQNFYHKNPKLCGKFTGECIDLDTCTLRTPSGYCTHWTKPEEARAIFEEEIGVEVVELLEKGNGVMVAGRVRA
jgi:SAM-dependent methyltransferase